MDGTFPTVVSSLLTNYQQSKEGKLKEDLNTDTKWFDQKAAASLHLSEHYNHWAQCMFVCEKEDPKKKKSAYTHRKGRKQGIYITV